MTNTTKTTIKRHLTETLFAAIFVAFCGAIGLGVLTLATGDVAFASDRKITIFVDEKPVQTDVDPYLKNQRTMVPIRFVSEALGAEVSWNALTNGVTIKSSKTTIRMTIGLLKGYLQKVGLAEQESTYDMPPETKNGRTFVPLRFVSENLGATVKWDGNTNTVNIYSEGFVPTEIPVVVGQKVGEFTVPASVVAIPGIVIEGPNKASLIDISMMKSSDLTEERIKGINAMFAAKYGATVGNKAEEMVRSGMQRKGVPDYTIPGTKDHISMLPEGSTVSIGVLRY
jgi:hypothetical protein